MRFAALTLLLLMAFDLGADVVYGEAGDLALPMASAPASPVTADSPTDAGQDTSSGLTHECFCCCTHLEQGVPTVVYVSSDSTQGFIRPSLSLPDEYPVHIYHPPQYRS